MLPVKCHQLYRRKRGNRRLILLLFVFAGALQSFGVDFSVNTSFDGNVSEKWLHRAPGILPVFQNTDTVYNGLPVTITVVVREYSRNYFGIADLYFSYRILRPDGSVFRDSSGISACSGFTDTDTGMLPGAYSPRVFFPENEPPGTYTLTVTVDDRIDGTTKVRRKKLLLSKYPQTDTRRFDVVSFNMWLHNYCIAPDPAGAVSAFAWFMGSTSSNDDRVFWPVFYFFQSLFYHNPALIDALLREYPGSSPRVREYTVLLLRLLEIKRQQRWPISDTRWKKFDAMKETGYLNPFAITLKSGSVQFMEFGFYYYGRYAMLRFLIECLGLHSTQGYKEFAAYCKKQVDSSVVVPGQGTALQFYAYAKKILSTAYTKHQLLHMYCNYALAYDHLSPGAERELRAIMLKAGK